jgi:peroxiredoxin
MPTWTRMLALSLGLASAPSALAAPQRPLEEGKPVPAFQLFTADHSTKVKLEELAYPGAERSWARKRPVLIDFFRTDCGPCRQSLPELVALTEKHRPQGLEVVMIALLEEDRGQEKLEAFLKERPLPFPVVVDATEHVARKYLGDTAPLPATFLVDREGRLLRSKHDARGSLAEHFAPAIATALGAKATGAD